MSGLPQHMATHCSRFVAKHLEFVAVTLGSISAGHFVEDRKNEQVISGQNRVRESLSQQRTAQHTACYITSDDGLLAALGLAIRHSEALLKAHSGLGLRAAEALDSVCRVQKGGAVVDGLTAPVSAVLASYARLQELDTCLAFAVDRARPANRKPQEAVRVDQRWHTATALEVAGEPGARLGVGVVHHPERGQTLVTGCYPLCARVLRYWGATLMATVRALVGHFIRLFETVWTGTSRLLCEPCTACVRRFDHRGRGTAHGLAERANTRHKHVREYRDCSSATFACREIDNKKKKKKEKEKEKKNKKKDAHEHAQRNNQKPKKKGKDNSHNKR